MSYGDYVEQLTYLLFLKMADERTKPPYNQPSAVPAKYNWPTLLKKDGDDLFVVDLLVDDRVVVELKSVEKLAPVHSKQLLTYIRLMKLPVGLLINFGASTLKEGLHRIVNDLPASAAPRLRVNQEKV
jgi:GxxExxY protein